MSAAARTFGGGGFLCAGAVTSADELGQLALSFNNMANSLSNSEGTRRSFIANVSHELKTPMTTIAGFIDGILDGNHPQGAGGQIPAHRLRRGEAPVPAGKVHAGPLPH